MDINLLSCNTVWDHQINDLFVKDTESEVDQFLNIVGLLIYSNSSYKDISNVYKILGLDNFSKLLSVVGGRSVKLPSKSDFKETIELAVIYYYKKIKKIDCYDDIRKLVPFEFNSISIGNKIGRLDCKITKMLDDVFNNVEKEV